MSADLAWLSEAIPLGNGWALDLGGGKGLLQDIVEKKGWRYVNVDLQPSCKSLAVCADCHALPFKDKTFSLVIAKDSLEHFINPWQSVREVRRVLKDGGTFVIWVPFMWPFHGEDFYRYTPLAFEKLLEGFRLIRFDTPVWVFGVIGLALIEILKRLRCGFLERLIRNTNPLAGPSVPTASDKPAFLLPERI